MCYSDNASGNKCYAKKSFTAVPALEAGLPDCEGLYLTTFQGGIPMKKLFMAVLTFILVSFSAVGLAARFDTCALLIADADMKTEDYIV